MVPSFSARNSHPPPAPFWVRRPLGVVRHPDGIDLHPEEDRGADEFVGHEGAGLELVAVVLGRLGAVMCCGPQ